jgi:hypothetical protein
VLPYDGHPVVTLAQPDGRIVLVSSHPDADFVVRRLTAEGKPDRSFGGDGTAVADFGGTTRRTRRCCSPTAPWS